MRSLLRPSYNSANFPQFLLSKLASCCGACALAGVAVYASSVAQAPSNAPVQQFQSGIEMVRLDVSVVDAGGMPVPDLKAEDFRILEDGQPQSVATLYEVRLPDILTSVGESAPWLRDTPRDVSSNTDFKDRRVVVVVVDDAIPMPAQSVLQFPAWARRVVGRLAPGDLAAVVYCLNKSAGQDFTMDRSRLMAAIDRFSAPFGVGTASIEMQVTSQGTAPGIKVEPYGFDKYNKSYTFNYLAVAKTLRGVAEHLAAIPDRKKAIVLVSVGIPIDWSGSGSVETSAGGEDVPIEAYQVLDELRDVLKAAQRANVNVYGLDPGGLRAPGTAGVSDQLNPAWRNRGFLKSLGERTGGGAIVDTNDPDPGIERLLRENGSYYLLGYVPSNLRTEGRFRKVEVRVNRPGLTVRGRNGYYEPRPAAKKTTPTREIRPVDLTEATAGPVPKLDLPLQVTAVPVQVRGREAVVALALAVAAYAPDRATRAVLQVELATAAYGPDGVRRGGKRQKIPVNLNFPGFGKTVGFELLSRLELPPGRYQLRLAVETSVEGARVSDRSPKVALFGIGEDLSSKTGSIYCDVDVPDFQNERLAMSGVALMTSPPTPSGPPRALANVLPVIPTTLRDFMTTDAVDGFVRVSQGGTEVLEPVTITLRIVDARGTTVAEQTEELSQSVFSRDRTADYRFALPLAGLSRGQYLLTVASRAARASAKREVRFTIHK